MIADTPLILAIDNGTQSVRALLFDGEGNLLGSSKQELEPYFSTQPGWAEQHPQYFWDALGQAGQQLWQTTDANPAQVKGVTLTTQRGTVVNLDANGTPLRPAIIWLDHRHGEYHQPTLRRTGAFYTALPGSHPRPVFHRSHDLPGLLDGELVQTGIRIARAFAGRAAWHGAGAAVR